jgi:hypothetical protein
MLEKLPVHFLWRLACNEAWRDGDLEMLSRVLRGNLEIRRGERLLLAQLFERSRLVGTKRGPKRRPIELKQTIGADVYRARRDETKQLKRLKGPARKAALEAAASLAGVTVKYFESRLDRESAIEDAASFAGITVEQLEQHLKRSRKPRV